MNGPIWWEHVIVQLPKLPLRNLFLAAPSLRRIGCPALLYYMLLDIEMIEEEIPLLEEGEQPEPTVSLEISLCEAVTYASWQNSVAFLRSLRIVNDTNETLNGLRLVFETSPAFALSKTWTVDRVDADGSLEVSDRDVRFDPDYLKNLNEAERGVARFRLIDGLGEALAEAEHDIRLLARDEWGGFGSMASLLAAFVMPNDPAIAALLKEAGKVLARYGHSSALDGYQSRDPQRAYMLGAALWSALAAWDLTYAEPPKSFERQGQKVRRPSAVRDQGLATCLDTTVLFAAGLEAIGLNPVIVLLDGHSFTGFWLVKKTLPNLIETDAAELRKALAAREFIAFETTAITRAPAATFDEALALAKHALSEQEEDRFVAALDVARARANQIRPLASHRDAPATTGSEPVEAAPLPLPALPDFGAMPAESAEEMPTTPEGRIERWQRKLLDLSLRNRLLNFRPTAQTIPFVCPDVPYLEDRLADAARIRIISLPEENPHGDRDTAMHLRTTGSDLDLTFALDSLQRDELASPLNVRDLDARLIKLYRQAKSDLNEGGSNTLFLAVGFLRWKKTPEDEKTYRAPLLLVPVKLERRSASSRFHLLHHEDDVRFNSTLLQFLKKDFDLDLPQFEGQLPTDESGIDVPLVLARMRRAVRDVPGFEVVDETALSTFSFAKYLMWKDLVDRTDQLRNNRVVRHLIDNPDKAFEPSVSTAFPTEREIDTRYRPQDIVAPMPADSSQVSAALAAAEGQDFVLIGPPGTGKSQTITNMIAQCLATGKSVLFVAEKTAALDVVHRRLKQVGLGEHCLELHSNKAERKAFLGQLKASWEANSGVRGQDWAQINEKLELHRDTLNAYTQALHREAPCGLTVFRALGTCVKGQNDFAPEPRWEPTVVHDKDGYATLESLIDEIALTHGAVRPVPALRHVAATDWSFGWQQDLVARCVSLADAAAALESASARFRIAVGAGHLEDGSLKVIAEMTAIAKMALATRGKKLGIALNPAFDTLKASVETLGGAIERYRQAERALSAAYEEGDIARVPVDEIDGDWRRANAAFGPMAFFAKRKVRKLLQSYARSGEVDPDIDIPHLRRMQQALGEIDGSGLKGAVPQWHGLATDIDDVRALMNEADTVRSAVARVRRHAETVAQAAGGLEECIARGDAAHPVLQTADEMVAAYGTFAAELKAYRETAGTLPGDPENPTFLADMADNLAEITANGTALQAWTAWRSVAERAAAHGLSGFIDALQAGHVAAADLLPAFRLAYARWWLPKVIDADPTLRGFRSFQHEEALRQFRELDDAARGLAAAQVRRSLARELPRPQEVPRNSELGLLRYQMDLQRPSKSIRDMISAMPTQFGVLAPCLLMSPLSIAQYLPADQAQFDVVIFDEASQITTWDAIGAIARGRQTIIVGDPKQLPPTNFFGRADGGDDSEEVDFFERDLPSILEETKAAGIPTIDLKWHYRSRHESLIAFSNWHYYGNRLITFPSPVTDDRAVRLVFQRDAVYDRGKSRTNRAEAEAIVRDACQRLWSWLQLAEDQRPTLGVITFNAQQQSLIQDLFDEARRDDPELEWFFADEREEPLIVRNLENVQGDERDVMMFSITFGPDQAGKLSMSFGAVNADGGEKRLNVAVTRAREELLVYASITADKIDLGRTKALGVAHLKTFLDMAERGAVALPAVDQGSVGGFDSPFEEAVAAMLSARGWRLVPQVGVSGYRIDLGVVHPDAPGAYLAGIECDGATYHGAATARDRDKVREQVLRGLGWSILRIWSPDWWYDRTGTLDKVDAALNALLETGRREAAEREAVERAAEEARIEAEQRDADRRREEASRLALDRPEPEPEDVETEKRDTEPGSEEPLRPHGPAGLPADATPPDDEDAPRLVAGHVRTAAPAASVTVTGPAFRKADLSGIRADPAAFYDFSYRTTLEAMVRAVVEAEAPVRADVLAQRIARAHGWLRTGARIRERIDMHLRSIETTDESTGCFLWRDGQRADVIDYRLPASEDDIRPVSEIALAEIAGIIRDNQEALNENDPALIIARLIGLDRLAATSRSRIEDAIEYWRRVQTAGGPRREEGRGIA